MVAPDAEFFKFIVYAAEKGEAKVQDNENPEVAHQGGVSRLEKINL